jgi:hypothetical protein
MVAGSSGIDTSAWPVVIALPAPGALLRNDRDGNATVIVAVELDERRRHRIKGKGDRE